MYIFPTWHLFPSSFAPNSWIKLAWNLWVYSQSSFILLFTLKFIYSVSKFKLIFFVSFKVLLKFLIYLKLSLFTLKAWELWTRLMAELVAEFENFEKFLKICLCHKYKTYNLDIEFLINWRIFTVILTKLEIYPFNLLWLRKLNNLAQHGLAFRYFFYYYLLQKKKCVEKNNL